MCESMGEYSMYVFQECSTTSSVSFSLLLRLIHSLTQPINGCFKTCGVGDFVFFCDLLYSFVIACVSMCLCYMKRGCKKIQRIS